MRVIRCLGVLLVCLVLIDGYGSRSLCEGNLFLGLLISLYDGRFVFGGVRIAKWAVCFFTFDVAKFSKFQ